MATSNSSPVEFRIPQESLPVPTLNNVELDPILSHDSESFVVIKSAAEIDEISDTETESLLQENKQILRDELSQLETSRFPQPYSSLSKHESLLDQFSNKEPEQNGTDSLEKSPSVDVSESSTETVTPNCMNQSVLPAMPQPQVTRMDRDDPNSGAISILSFAPSDFGSEEIQVKVTQLIDENTHLKEVLIQNNQSMKANYDRIVAWQNDVERVYEEHKQKYKKSKELIDTLKKDNICLKQENDDLKYSLEQMRSEHDKTKQLLTDRSETNLKEFELDAANQKIRYLEDAIQKMNICNNQKQEAQDFEDAKYKAMEGKLVRYEKELENAYKQIRQFGKATPEQERSEQDKLKLIQEKLLLSEMANERANNEIMSLRNQLAKTVQTNDDTSKVQLTLNQVISERNRLATELQSANASIMDAHARSQNFEQELQQANEMVRQYEEINKGLKDQAEQANIEAWKMKQRLMELEHKFQTVSKTTEGYQQAPLGSPINPNEMAYLRQQLMQSQRSLIDSEQNRAVADAKVITLQNQIADLTRQLTTNQTDNDDMYALRAQLDVYKTDFEAEREAKEDIKRDKNKIAEDLQHLNRRNQQLQEEIELLREQLSHSPNSLARNGRPEPRNEASASSPILQRYTCPICNVKFRSLKLVQDHLDTCICHAP